MSNTTPPPDMTREQCRELKQLHARLNRSVRLTNAEEKKTARAILKLEQSITHQRAVIAREGRRELKKFAAVVHAEIRPLRMRLHRILLGNTAEAKERKAILKRIAILDGRQGS